MIIYNITVKVAHEVHDDWMIWMNEIHIPAVMETGFFVDNKFYKVLLQDESDGITYAIQYFCESMGNLQKYQGQHAPRLQKEHIDRYGEKCLTFRTLLETVPNQK